MKKWNLPAAVIAVFISIVFSLHDLHAEGALDLQSAIDTSLKSNPEIISAKRNYQAASARIWQAASLADPVLELEYDKMTADRMLSGEPMKTYAVSQEIPFPTKLYLRAKIASKLARIAYEAYKAKERSVISQVKAAYSELALIYKSIDIMKEDKAILEQFSNSATTRYSVGKGTQADALRAQVELAKVMNELIMLEQRRAVTQARLNILMDKDPKEEIGVPSGEGVITFTGTLEEFYMAARENNPELKAYRYAIERGRAAYDLSLNEFMPDFMVKFKQMVKRDRVDENAWAGMVGVTVPLWFFEKQAFGVKEMKSELEMVRAEYKMKQNMVLFDVRDSYARIEANKKIVELYETAFIPQANETVKATTKSYESERSDFLTLLDSQRMLIEFKLDHYRAILDLRVALADLERAIGTDLDIKK